MRQWARRTAGFGGAIFVGVLLVWGVRVTVLQMATGQTTAALGLPMWVVGLAVPAGALLMLVHILRAARKRGRE